MKQAFIFDLNGTIVDDMRFHQEAWYLVLTDLGAKLTHEEVIHELYGKDEELLTRIFGKSSAVVKDVPSVTSRVETKYQDIVRNKLQPINGLPQFFEKLKANKKLMAIGTGASKLNTEFIVGHLNIGHLFNVIVKSEDVNQGKPDPETYLKILSSLNVPASSCVVFEDTPSGAEAALRAGMECVIITTLHQPEQFELGDKIKYFINDYTDQRLNNLI